jgi:hypothetical protein
MLARARGRGCFVGMLSIRRAKEIAHFESDDSDNSNNHKWNKRPNSMALILREGTLIDI